MSCWGCGPDYTGELTTIDGNDYCVPCIEECVETGILTTTQAYG